MPALPKPCTCPGDRCGPTGTGLVQLGSDRHTSNEGFAKEFGSHQSWRRTLNDWADSEAGKRANAAQPLSRAVKIQYLDRVVAHVIHHLAQRVQAALDHTDKDLVKKTNCQAKATNKGTSSKPCYKARTKSSECRPKWTPHRQLKVISGRSKSLRPISL